MYPKLVYSLFIGCLLSHIIASNEEFDELFQAFLAENGYRGGSVAAMKDGRLVLAEGYGTNRDGHRVSAHTKLHVSSLAKSLTAVAILLLVQDQRVKLDDKVFGHTGLLNMMSPWGRVEDQRIYNITIKQLLQHTAGWSNDKPPLYDPLLNPVYIQRGHDVPNIAEEMGIQRSLDPEELISYVMAKPLDFDPGTKVAYSNVAYLVLGRVIEATVQMEYRDFVKKYILDPCGMWNTRLERPTQTAQDTESILETKPSIFDSINSYSVDSALGWYSNAYDLMRFVRCTFDSHILLDNTYMELLLSKPDIVTEDSWSAAGFHTNTKGIVWQDADLHADDLILYHNTHSGRKRRYVKADLSDDMPHSWIILLCDKNKNHLKHVSRELMSNLKLKDYDYLAGDSSLFLKDLSKIHVHPMWTQPLRFEPEFTIIYDLDEHRLSAYITALQDEAFNIHWFTSYTSTSHNNHVKFLVVGKKITHPIKSDYDFVFDHGLDWRKLQTRKLQLEEAGYNMTTLHSYKSRSHDNPFSFAAVFRRRAFTQDMQMKYGTNHLPEPYEKLVQMYQEKHFYPLSQTVVHYKQDEHFSFIFVRKQGEYPISFQHYYDLSAKRLVKITAEKIKQNLRLSYLNSYNVVGKFRFSAIFTNETTALGILETEQPQNKATEMTISNIKDGFIPKFIVPYLNNEGEIVTAIYFEEK